MKNFTKLFPIIFIVISVSGFSQRKAAQEIKTMLPEMTVDIEMLGLVTTPRHEELLGKFQLGVQKNYEWFAKSMSERKPGEKAPYHPNLGLTESEYEELNKFRDDLSLKVIEKGKLKILWNNNTITFEAEGKFQIFRAITIDVDQKIVKIGDNVLPFSHHPDISNASNALKSKWKGYSWKLEEPKGVNLATLEAVSTATAKLYTFTLGRIEKSGKTFISMKGIEIVDGEKTVNFDVPFTIPL